MIITKPCIKVLTSMAVLIHTYTCYKDSHYTTINLYKTLLENVENASVYLEEYARTMIGQEEQHTIELKKMLKDYS